MNNGKLGNGKQGYGILGNVNLEKGKLGNCGNGKSENLKF